MSVKKCPYCAEEIQDAAIVCKHCKRNLNAMVGVAAPMPGKSAGRITIVGYLGIGLGVLLAVTGVLALATAATADAGGALFISAVGVGLAALCYLYVRR